MTSIVFDYADIRSRMLGEDKPRAKAAPVLIGVDLARPGSDSTVLMVRLPDGQTFPFRELCKPMTAPISGDPRSVISPKAVERMTAAEEWRKIVRGDWP